MICENRFSLLKIDPQKNNGVNISIPIMSKPRSAWVYLLLETAELFKGDLSGIPHCFSVDGTDEIFHDIKSFMYD